MSHLQPLAPRESAVAACARSLRESILRGDLAPGTPLPPERALAATFGVNRLTLRAALSQLGAAGLIAVRHGSGNVVRAFSEAGGPDLLPTLVSLARGRQWREVVSDLLRVRRALARAMLERLSESIDARRLRQLEQAVDAFAAAVELPGATPDSIALADQQVVRTLLAHTGVVLALAANPIFKLLDALPELREAMFATPTLNLAGYRLLLAGLRRKDPQLSIQVIEALATMDHALLGRLKRRSR